jgi:hypothetical protein
MGFGRADVNSCNAGVGVGAAHKRERHSTRQVDIIDIAALPQKHAWVLDPSYLCADQFACANETGCHNFSKKLSAFSYQLSAKTYFCW